MFSPERRRRAVHKLAVTAAALAVCVLPTACDYPLASPPGAPTGPGGGTERATTAPVVVPVGNTSETSAAPDSTTSRTRTKRTKTSPAGALVGCDVRPVAPVGNPTDSESPAPSSTDPAAPTSTNDSAAPTTTADTSAPAAPGEIPVVAPGGKDGANNGQDVLGRDCTQSKLPPHNGFQESPACVATAMGEVAAEESSRRC